MPKYNPKRSQHYKISHQVSSRFFLRKKVPEFDIYIKGVRYLVKQCSSEPMSKDEINNLPAVKMLSHLMRVPIEETAQMVFDAVQNRQTKEYY